MRQFANKGGHFFLQNTDQRVAERLSQAFLHELLKGFLTRFDAFGIVRGVSHWYPPGLI